MIAKLITRTKTPVILTFHEGGVHKPKGVVVNDGDFVRRLVSSNGIKKLGLSMVDMVITVQEELLKPLNFKGKYMVLPCGVDLDLFRPIDREWCRKKLILPLDKKIVFFPAIPGDKQKGFDIINETLSLLGREDIELLVGGNIYHEDMPYYMCAADAVVQLSLWEASPMVLKEAMAVNVPIVFTDVGDAKLTMGKAKGCFLCKRTPRDVALKLEDALRSNGNSEGRKRIIEAGLGLTDVARKIKEIYEGYKS